MTWENLTADADALREALGFERWAVLGHSFGGFVALEYALRYPGAAVAPRPARHRRATHAGRRRTCRRCSLRGAATTRRPCAWPNGSSPDGSAPNEMPTGLIRFGGAYYHHHETLPVVADGPRPDARRVAVEDAARGADLGRRGSCCRAGASWIGSASITVPTLVMAGRDDFVFPPEHQAQLAARRSRTRGFGSSSVPATTRTPSGPRPSWPR